MVILRLMQKQIRLFFRVILDYILYSERFGERLFIKKLVFYEQFYNPFRISLGLLHLPFFHFDTLFSIYIFIFCIPRLPRFSVPRDCICFSFFQFLSNFSFCLVYIHMLYMLYMLLLRNLSKHSLIVYIYICYAIYQDIL